MEVKNNNRLDFRIVIVGPLDLEVDSIATSANSILGHTTVDRCYQDELNTIIDILGYITHHTYEIPWFLLELGKLGVLALAHVWGNWEDWTKYELVEGNVTCIRYGTNSVSTITWEDIKRVQGIVWT